MKRFLPIFLFVLSLLLHHVSACAQPLHIFAWLENDNIIIQCDSGQNHPAANARVIIKDNVTGQDLEHGKTGDNGQFVFRVPDGVRQGHAILISVDAGPGLQGNWLMAAPELYAAAALTTGFDEARIAEQRQYGDRIPLSPAAAPTMSAPQSVQAPAPSAQEIKAMLSEMLEEQLTPIRQELAAKPASGYTVVEIIGAVGWLIGLIGVALYFKSRKA